jgi:hypothetical protein
MLDLAHLGITVSADGAIQSVDRLGAGLDRLGAKGTAATSVTGGFGDANLRAAEAAEHHSLSLGRVEKSFERVIVQATGANEQLALLGAAFGHLEVGAVDMIAALAAGFLAVKVFEAWHEEANKARDEQDKLTDSLLKWYEVQKQGPAGALTGEIAAMTTKVKELHKEMDDLMSSSFFTRAPATLSMVGEGGSKPMAWLRVVTSSLFGGTWDQLATEVEKGAAHVTKTITDGGHAIVAGVKKSAEEIEAAAVAARAKALSQETDLLGTGLAGPGAVQKMQAQIEQYTRLSKQFVAAGDITHALEYAHAVQQLGDAINKETAEEQKRVAEAQKNIAATNERIAQLAIEIDADQRMALAKFQGQDAVDKLTIALAGETVAREAAGKGMPDQIAKLKLLAEQHAANAIAARKQSEAEKQLADDIQAAAKGVVDKINQDAAAVKAQAKYAQEMEKAWLGFIEHVTTSGLTSFKSFFDSVYSLFAQMLEKMQAAGKGNEIGAKLLGLGSDAVGAGLAGYSVGASTQGNRGSSALFGALGGAASGAAIGSVVPGIGTAIGAAVGSIAGLVGGILGAGHAADLSATEMANLQKSLTTSIQDVKAQLAGDALGSAIAQVHAQFDAMRTAAENAYATGKNEAQRNVVLAQLNDLEAQRTAQLKAEFALMQQQAQEDYKVRELAATGHQDEADALAFAEAQQREYNAAVKAGADATTLAALQDAQAADASKRIDDLAAAAKTAADAASLAAAQALEQAATAAAAAAAVAAQKAQDQQRAYEDLSVEMLNAQGKTGAASDLEFVLAQQRRLADAQQNQSADYVAKLLELQQLQRDSRAAQALIDSTTGASGSLGSAAASAQTAVQSTVTERTAYMLVDIGRAQLTTLHEILSAILSQGGGASLRDINQGLGSGSVTAGLYSGSVSR